MHIEIHHWIVYPVNRLLSVIIPNQWRRQGVFIGRAQLLSGMACDCSIQFDDTRAILELFLT